MRLAQLLRSRPGSRDPGLIVGDEIVDLSDPATGLPADHGRTAGARSRRALSGSAPHRQAGRPAIRCRRCGVTRPCPIRPPSSPSA